MRPAGADALLRYRVLRSLGPTHFGHAQLALLEGEGRSKGFFALELLREDWARDAELRECFLEEAAHTLHFEHPNVVRTQEVLAAPEVCGRVTRWFAGQSLAIVLQRVGRAQFPLHLHVRVLCEVLAAVQYLHELEQAAGGRLVYRDTAPAHVLVTYTGQIKIVGAGFERTIDEIERRSGVLFSDLDYASPELCLGYPAAPGADVYSVGVLLWEALARARRVFADTPEAKVRMRINGEEPDVDQFRRGVPERLSQICRRALAVSPRDRYASAQELQIDLESFLADTESDAQQNAGLGALAELMGQHFAAERAEMLGYIEQQLAEPEPSSAPGSRRAGLSERVSAGPSAPAPAAVSAVQGTEPAAPRLELADELDDLEDEVEEGPTELLSSLEPARWDEHTHTVTSFEELGPVEPPAEPPAPSSVSLRLVELHGAPESADDVLDPLAARERELLEGVARDGASEDESVPDELLHEPAPHGSVRAGSAPPHVSMPEPRARPELLQLPVREPDTSGHRAYSATLQPPAPPPREWLRTAAPVGFAAALVLLLGYGIRVARSSSREAGASAQHVGSAELAVRPASSAVVSDAEPRRQAAPAAPDAVEIVHPSALIEVAASEPPESPGAPPAGAEADVVELVAQGTAAPEVVLEAEPSGAVISVPGEAEPASAQPGVATIPEGGSGPSEAAATSVAEQAPSAPADAPPSEDGELEPPPLIVEELLNGEERRPPPRARRSRVKAGDGRGTRANLPKPRTIDETDPYLD